MKLRHELPHVALEYKNDNVTRIPVIWKDDFLAAWKGGKSFWDGITIYGSFVYIKLGEVYRVVELTEDSIAVLLEEQEVEKARNLTDV